MARDWEDARCQFSVQFAADSLAALKAMLDPSNFFESGCRVIKHPGCCVLCAANNDCDKLPMHVHCRCEPDHYLFALEK